jgi:acetyl-CoA decarbonylase/synthase complex subunit gamma
MAYGAFYMETRQGCCSGGDTLWIPKKQHSAWVTGVIESPVGPVPRIASTWSKQERRGHLLCRLSNRFRMSYSVEPGLYAAGNPDPDASVLVTANFKLSFDLLRRELGGLDAWILVLDTKGINVWCAAGKGTFGTSELVRRLRAVQLSELVRHRRLVLPQLGAPGIQAHRVKEETGFAVSFGPVRARDLPAYLRAGLKATPAMRAVRFGLLDRLELTPMELVPALKRLPWLLLGLALLFGLRPEGILFRQLLADGWPFALLGLAMVLAGAFLTPALLPLLPSRSFALKGWVAGAVLTTGSLLLFRRVIQVNLFLAPLAILLFPAVSSFLAMNFTGSTPFTGLSGVRKELRYALPLYMTALVLSAASSVLYLVHKWGFL